MDPSSAASESSSGRKSRLGGKKKVKSGCRTCKIRKVKCDEGRPSCHRCVSTGRTCDGYGVWGGGGNDYGSREPLTNNNTTQVAKFASFSPPVIAAAATSVERVHFEWFLRRTSAKLSGAFPSSFWATLVLQASADEPAVLYAVLALTSAHKSEIVGGKSAEIDRFVVDEQETFTLRSYSNAIKHLHPHFAARSKASIRVALISCLVFIYMENLRGHYQSGQVHLQNGLKLLRGMQDFPNEAKHVDLFAIRSHHDFVDTCIIDNLTKLYIQARLYGQDFPDCHTSLECEVLPTMFDSPSQARRHLELLMVRIFHLVDEFQETRITPDGTDLALLRLSQASIQNDLTTFHTVLLISQNNFANLRDEFAYQLLFTHLAMASIMAATVLAPSELSYDSHTPLFISIITQSIKLAKMAAPFHIVEPIPLGSSFISYGRSATEIRKSIADIGWIPPLYYTAIKCRVRRIRMQAIRLLAETTHREGIWDADSVRRVAEEVGRIEEGNVGGCDVSGQFETHCAPTMEDVEDVEGKIVEERERVFDVKMVVSNGDEGGLVMTCRRKKDDGYETIVTRFVVG